MEPTADTFKRRLKEAREAKNWSQQRLADELGVSMGAVRKWEQRDSGLPRPAMQDRIATKLGRPLAWFYGQELHVVDGDGPTRRAAGGQDPLAELAVAVGQLRETQELIVRLATGNVGRFEDLRVRLERIEALLHQRRPRRRSTG